MPIALVVVLTMTNILEVAFNLPPVLTILTVTVVPPKDMANWHARTVIANLSYQMSNAPHAGVWAMWLSTATCLPLQSVWNDTCNMTCPLHFGT